jgi:hypothetical protein
LYRDRGRYRLIVRTLFAKLVRNCASARVAGPFTTAPLVVYCDPWHGHSNVEFAKLLTTQPSCVQTAVSAVNASPARETRKLPLDVATSAALPVDASGELASIVIEMTPPTTVALIVRSDGSVEPPDDPVDEVGLPPHPVIADAIDASDIVPRA